MRVTARGRGAVRSPCRRGVLQPADRAAASDRLLRGPPAGVQLQHAGQARARRPEHRRRSSRRCSRAASIRPRIRPDEATGTSSGRRATTVRSLPRKPIGACSTRSSAAISIGRVIRCSIAPKRSSPSSSTRRCTRRRCSTCGTGCRSSRSGVRRAIDLRSMAASLRTSGSRFPPAARRSASIDDALPFGWDNERPHLAADVAAFAIAAARRHQRRLPRVRRRRRLATRGAAAGWERAAVHPLFWERRWPGTGAGCSI